MDTQIATTILSQLGGNHFVVMTGAKQFVALENGIKFKIGKNYSKANMLKITLNGSDTYDMEFIKMPGQPNYLNLMQNCKTHDEFIQEVEKRTTPKILKTYNDVYCDMLQDLFTEYTHMYTHL